MTRIDATPLGLHGGHPPPGGQTPAQTGSFRGEALSVKDELSILADAAEEISLHHSEKAEQKKHAERTLETESELRIAQIEQIEAYLEATQAFHDATKLAGLAKRMREATGEPPREIARQQTRHPAQQYALLRHALEGDDEDGEISPARRQAIEDALADLEMDHGPLIRASLNTFGAASEWQREGEDLAQFQEAYCDVVLGNTSLSQTLQLVLERLSGPQGQDFARGLQGLIKALGTDLSAARPSIDPHRLQALVQDLYQLEVVATVLDGCKELAATLEARHGLRGLEPFPLMKDLVMVTGEKWVSAMRFTGLADRHQVQDVGARITFLSAVKGLVRELPPQVFTDPDTRQSILGAAQDALDSAIDQEEE